MVKKAMSKHECQTLGITLADNLSALFCICLRRHGCYGTYLAFENWNSVLCFNVSLLAFRCRIKMAVPLSSPFFCLLKMGKTLKVMEYLYIIITEAKKSHQLLRRHRTLSHLLGV